MLRGEVEVTRQSVNSEIPLALLRDLCHFNGIRKQPKKYPYDILLAGIGTGGKDATTIGTVDLLKEARIAFNMSVHSDFVHSICPNVVELRESYFTGEEDERVYKRFVRRAIDEAQREGGVAMVDDGHPLVFDDVNEKIAARGKRLGLKVVILPAVSSIDAMMVQCGLRLNPTGTQLVEATTLVLHRQKLNPTLDTLVLQIGWFGTSLLTEIKAHTKERFLPLQQYLLHFFPPSHRVRVMRASLAPDEEPLSLGCTLNHLSRQYKWIPTDSTLFIPALKEDAVVDAGFLDQLTDRAHLVRIARL